MVWGGRGTGYSTDDQIWYALYNGTWQAPVRISTATDMENYEQGRPSIAVDSDDYLHVVWNGPLDNTWYDRRVWYAKCTVNWTTPVLIYNENTYDQINPSIAIDSNDYLHVVWFAKGPPSYNRYQIYYTKYVDSWSTPISISTAEGMDEYSQYYPSIAVDFNDHLHVVWEGQQGSPYYYQIYYTKCSVLSSDFLQPMVNRIFTGELA